MATLPPPSWQSRLPFFYGWVIVGGLVVTGCINNSFYWLPALFVLPMHEELGWSRTSIIAALTVRGLVGAFVSPFFGALLDKPDGARRLAAFAGLVGGSALIPIAWVQEEWQFLLLFGVIGGISQVGQSMAVMGAVLPRWFIHKRGSAMATATMGPPFGSFFTPLVVGAFIGTLGWRTAWIAAGLLIMLLGTIPAIFFHRQPEDVGLRPDGVLETRNFTSGPRGPDPTRGATVGEALRSPTFWLLSFAVSIANLATSSLPASLASMFVDRGVRLDLALLGISLHGVGSLASRFLWGWCTNRFHIRSVLQIIAVMGILATPLPFVMHGDIIVIYGGIIGVAIGGFVSTNQLIWPAYFGRTHLGAITGWVRPLQTSVSAVAPLSVPFIYERTGDYAPAIWMVTAAWTVFALCLWLAPGRGEAGG